ncbi:MAG: DNA repair protein RecO [Acidimicrobiaceae bacterium]|nr:DNA repair protein RecO [Acidimicrobiaceae bacterium]
MGLYRDEAVVLRTWKLGEADRIVNLHTLAHGKVRAVAKGVRRTRSKFGARLEPACRVAVQLYRGRGELDTLTQAETIDRFASLRSDPGSFARASAMLEAVDHLAPETGGDPDRHVMLVRALTTLDRVDSELVLAGFFLKLLALEGVQPELASCVACGAGEPFEALDIDAGGVLCHRCRHGRPISREALEMLRQVLGGQLGAALRRPADDATAEVTAIATAAIESHLERRLRSVTVLDRH